MIAADSAGNVFIPDVGAISEQQKYTVAATGSTYKLLFEGEETTGLPYNAAEYEVAEALEALAKIGPGNVSVCRSGQTYTVSYGGTLEKIDLPLLSADSTNLTEGVCHQTRNGGRRHQRTATLKEYAPNGTPKQTITCAACPSGGFTATPAGVAIDGEDNLYVADPAKSRVVIFHATPGTRPTTRRSRRPISPGAVRSVAVDPVTKQVFVGGDDGGGFHVKGYEPNGTLFADFGLGMFPGTFATFFGTEQLTVDGNTGTVYVGDLLHLRRNLATALVGFIPAPAPTIVAQPATVDRSVHPRDDERHGQPERDTRPQLQIRIRARHHLRHHGALHRPRLRDRTGAGERRGDRPDAGHQLPLPDRRDQRIRDHGRRRSGIQNPDRESERRHRRRLGAAVDGDARRNGQPDRPPADRMPLRIRARRHLRQRSSVHEPAGLGQRRRGRHGVGLRAGAEHELPLPARRDQRRRQARSPRTAN